MSFSLTLCDRDPRIVEAWRRHFGPDTGVTVVNQNLLTLNCDALVCPANSFGFTDGGMDLAISQFFDWTLQDTVREVIERDHDGELLVGSAVIVPTTSERFRYLIVAPTMRVPGDVSSSLNAYLAMRGVLRAALQHNKRIEFQDRNARKISSIATPGLATGIGGMPPRRAAFQMWIAYRNLMLGDPTPVPLTLDIHVRRDEEMRTLS